MWGRLTADQIRELRTFAERHGWIVADVFDAAGISGGVAREDRPAMKRLLRAVARREADKVAAWSVDRLGRSLLDLLGFLAELHGKKVGLYLHQHIQQQPARPGAGEGWLFPARFARCVTFMDEALHFGTARRMDRLQHRAHPEPASGHGDCNCWLKDTRRTAS